MPFPCRRNWFTVGFKFPFSIAFLTASVKDENEATCWIGLLSVLDGISASVEDLAVEEYKAVDDELFCGSDKYLILANGDQRLGTSVGEFGAKDQKFLFN